VSILHVYTPKRCAFFFFFFVLRRLFSGDFCLFFYSFGYVTNGQEIALFFFDMYSFFFSRGRFCSRSSKWEKNQRGEEDMFRIHFGYVRRRIEDMHRISICVCERVRLLRFSSNRFGHT